MVAKHVLNNTEEIQKKIGEKIRLLRESSGKKNYEKFAVENDMSRSHYWNIEQGKVNITIKTLSKILNALNTEMGTFFKELDLEHP